VKIRRIITIGLILLSVLILGKNILNLVDCIWINKELIAPDPPYTQKSYEYLQSEYRDLVNRVAFTGWLFLVYSFGVIAYCIYRFHK